MDNTEDAIDGEKLYTFDNGQKYIVNGSENISVAQNQE